MHPDLVMHVYAYHPIRVKESNKRMERVLFLSKRSGGAWKLLQESAESRRGFQVQKIWGLIEKQKRRKL